MSDTRELIAEIHALRALLLESQQQAQQRHREYIEIAKVLEAHMLAHESGVAIEQGPRIEVGATMRKAAVPSSSQTRKAPPQTPGRPTVNSGGSTQPKTPSKRSAPKPASAAKKASTATPQDLRDVDDSEQEDFLPDAKNRKRGARPPATNERNALVRGIVQKFLGFETEPRPDDQDGKVYSNFPPSPSAVYPLPDTLREAESIDWDSKLSSAFNRRVIVLLVSEARIHNRTGFYYTNAELSGAIKEHLRYLRGVREALLSPPDWAVELEERLYHSANTRKNSLSSARLEFVFRFRLAQYFHVSPDMLQVLLGVECTSEDERDDSFESATYRIRRLRWRNHKLTALLRLVDKCMELRARRKSGSNPRKRLEGDVEGENAAIPEGFPENWFDPAFLDELDTWGRQALLISREVKVQWEHLHSALRAILRQERQCTRKRPGETGHA